MNRRVRIRYWLIPLAASVFLSIAWWCADALTSRSLKTTSTKELTSVLRAKVDTVTQWLEEQKWSAEVQAKDARTRELVMGLVQLAAENDTTTATLLQSPQLAMLRQQLIPTCRVNGYIDFIISTRDGVNIAAWLDEPVGQRTLTRESGLLSTVLGGRTAVTNPFPAEVMLPDTQGVLRPDRPTMLAAAPIIDNRQQVVAVLAFRIRPEVDFTEILTDARVGQTGETYAFDPNGLMLTDTRFVNQLKTLGLLPDRRDAQSVLNVHIRDPGVDLSEGQVPTLSPELQPLTRMAAAAINGRDGVDVEGYRNYRGIDVIGAWAWLPEYNFGVATEVDITEAYHTLFMIRKVFGTVLAWLAVTAGVGLLLELKSRAWAQRLQAYERFAQNVFDNIAEGVVLTDEGGNISILNRAARQLFGYMSEELIGQHISMLIQDTRTTDPRGVDPLDPESVSRNHNGKNNNGRHKDGKLIPVEIKTSSVLHDQKRLIAYCVSDVSQRRSAEQALRDNEKQYRDFVEAIDEWVWSVDLQGNYTYCNPGVGAILGYGPDELIGEECFLAMHDEDRKEAQRTLTASIAEKTGWKGITRRWRHPDGSFRFLESTAIPILNQNGEILGLQGIDRDVTERIKVEENMMKFAEDLVVARNDMEAQAIELATKSQHLEQVSAIAKATNRAKSDFLANMSHEIRTPMTAILGYADILMDPHLPPTQQLEFVHIIRRNGQHLLTLINDILDISKIEAGRMTVERIESRPCEIVTEVVSLMKDRADDKNLTLEVEYRGSIPQTIRTDPTRLRQILVNLIGNAIKFTDSGGVKLMVELAGPSPEHPNRLVVRIIDSGIGITPQQREKLFDPFMQADNSTTRRFGGTGLGLAISKRLAEALGGGIELESRPGHGSTFTVSIDTGPLEGIEMLEDPQSPGPLDLETERPDTDVKNIRITGRILLAEDGPDNQRYLSYVLESTGAEVTLAENGRTALETAMEAHKTGKGFDLIFMDMQMPEMDGYDATSELRRQGYTAPIIALTAHAMSGDRRRSLDAGCDEFVTKPIDRIKLIRLAADYIHEQPRGGYMSENPPTTQNDSAAGAETNTPLYSEFADDPDMIELVEMFVHELPERVQQIQQAINGTDFTTLSHVSHQLKGAAGGYGFTPITEAAAVVERHAKDPSDLDGLKNSVDELISLCHRATSNPIQEC